MRKNTTPKENTSKRTTRVFSRKDFLRLLSKDKESAYQYYLVNITPFAHKIASDKINCGKTRTEKVSAIVQKAWERIGEFRKSKAETIFQWFRSMFEQELTLQMG